MTVADQETRLDAALARLQTLPSDKRAAFAQHLQTNGSAFNLFPLSFAQERLWLIDQLAPGNPVYNIPAAIRMRGPSYADLVERGINLIVARHEALRTRFVRVDGRPMQFVQPSLTIPMPRIDLSDLPPEIQQAELERLSVAEAREPFDLAQGPLIRIKLLRLHDEDHVLLLTMHHIVSDGWSIGVLVRELFALAEALYLQTEPPLAPLALQYPDFAVWQREWLQGEVLERQLDYWRGQLANSPPALELPADFQRPAVQTFTGANYPLHIPRATLDGLKALAQREGATLFMVLLAAFKTLLHRLSGQDDLVVGSPIANRNRAETEALIGFFVNTLVLRTDLGGAPSFLELLARVREVATAAYAHQDLPFEKLVAELHSARDMSRNPLFQVMFAFQNTPMPAFDRSGRSLQVMETDNGTAMVDLTLVLEEFPEGLVGSVEYSSDLFSAATVARMVEQLQLLLDQIVAAPEVSVLAYSLVTPATRALLPDPRAALAAAPLEPVSATVRRWAARQPDHPAVEQGGRRWSYAELAERADAVAGALVARGLERGDVVAVSGDRSFGTVAAMLGVLASGGVLLTLDRSLPVQRQQVMLAEACARQTVYVGEERPEDAWLLGQAGAPLAVDAATGGVDAAPAGALADPAPGDPAYLFFTSGTTGTPKGVLGRHQGLSHFLQWQRETFEVGPQDRSAQLTGLSFDVVLRDIFLPLSSGATLCLPEPGAAVGSAALLQWLDRSRISLLHTVPSLAQTWLANLPAGVALQSLRWVFFAGEPLQAALVERWRAAFPLSGRQANLYGPTETTLAKCCYQLPETLAPGVQPVGHPLPGAQALVLNGHQLCGVGEVGQVVIRTPFRSLGYVNAPEEQRRRFVPNPFRRDPEDIVYETGDRGRYRADGTLELLGRIDQQVKINGVRIEIGEIEAALASHPDITGAAVAARVDASGAKQLVGYVVPSKLRAPSFGGRRRYTLPNNMNVVHLNKNETDYLYKEIYVLQAYGRHGMTIRDGDCIFDVGGNMGLFTAYAHQLGRNLRMYTFDPNPTIFGILSANAAVYGPNARLFNFGISDSNKTAEFTFFPGFAMLSGFYTDAEVEKETIKNYMLNQQQLGQGETGALVAQVDDILRERFAGHTFTATLRTLSSVIKQEQVQQIDLLKINVEKSELDVLLGIDEDDWPKIKQVVLEVDVAENLTAIVALLDQHGFDYVVMQDTLLNNTELCYVYATRRGCDRTLIREQREGEHLRELPVLEPVALLTVNEVKRHLAERLPAEMVPAQIVFLDALPLTPNGKIDRRALPEPDGERPELEAVFVAPETELQQTIAAIWRDALGARQIGIHDNFFDLGGHSLLVAQVHNRLQIELQREISIVALFQHPTVGALAAHLSGGDAPLAAVQQSRERAETRKEAARRNRERRQR
jgi:amino acid adenylation domain-containing protein/FkbM family methyltransferase